MSTIPPHTTVAHHLCLMQLLLHSETFTETTPLKEIISTYQNHAKQIRTEYRRFHIKNRIERVKRLIKRYGEITLGAATNKAQAEYKQLTKHTYEFTDMVN